MQNGPHLESKKALKLEKAEIEQSFEALKTEYNDAFTEDTAPFVKEQKKLQEKMDKLLGTARKIIDKATKKYSKKLSKKGQSLSESKTVDERQDYEKEIYKQMGPIDKFRLKRYQEGGKTASKVQALQTQIDSIKTDHIDPIEEAGLARFANDDRVRSKKIRLAEVNRQLKIHATIEDPTFLADKLSKFTDQFSNEMFFHDSAAKERLREEWQFFLAVLPFLFQQSEFLLSLNRTLDTQAKETENNIRIESYHLETLLMQIDQDVNASPQALMEIKCKEMKISSLREFLSFIQKAQEIIRLNLEENLQTSSSSEEELSQITQSLAELSLAPSIVALQDVMAAPAFTPAMTESAKGVKAKIAFFDNKIQEITQAEAKRIADFEQGKRKYSYRRARHE